MFRLVTVQLLVCSVVYFPSLLVSQHISTRYELLHATACWLLPDPELPSILPDDWALCEKTICAKSRAISVVAAGREAFNAASFNVFIVSGEASQEPTVSAITSGSALNFPNPEFSTYGTFPSS